MNTIQKLENWKNGHKRRWVNIHIDNGYGASCWFVELHDGKHNCIYAQEVNFTEPPSDCIVYAVLSDDMEEWPGLEATINAALDAAEKV